MDCWIKHLSISILILLGATTHQSLAQSLELAPYCSAVSTKNLINPENALERLSSNSVIHGNTNFGFSKDFYWILIDEVPVVPKTNYVLDIDNPHIDRVDVWNITDSGLIHLGQSGDRIPFDERTVVNRRNVFQFETSESSVSLVVLADKRNAAVSVPLKLWTKDAFYKADNRYNIIHGLYFGMLLLIILYSLLIFALQQHSVYLWYAFYVAALFIYLFVHVGYGFQFLFPNHYEWSNYLRLIMMVTIIISQIRFTQKFIPIRSTAPQIHRILNWVIVSLVVIIVWWVLVPGLFTTYTIVVINAIYVIIGISLILLTLGLIRSWKADKISVLFYTVAFGANIFAALLMIAEEYGAINLGNWAIKPLFLGSFFEIIIFAIGLSYRSKLIVDDRQKLLSNIGTLKNQAMTSYLHGIEEEKERVSQELHDDIAARLGSIKLKMNIDQNKPLTAEIDGLIKGVRDLSHELSSPSFSDHDFVYQLHNLANESRTHSLSVELQVLDLETKLTSEHSLQLLRISQEALQNIRKHANASKVDLQLFEHESALVLTIEDNGSGFNQQIQTTGLGFKNMKNRAESINAEFSLSSAIGEGTSIMVSISKG